MNMRNRVSICTLIIGLICPFTQVAGGQQSDPVQPPPATMVEGPQRSTGGVSASDVATANNPIAPLNAIYFQNYYAPTVYGVPGSNNLLDLRTLVVSGTQRTGGAIKGPVAFHRHDPVRDNEVDRNGCTQVEDALLDALPVENILRPSISCTRHYTKHVF